MRFKIEVATKAKQELIDVTSRVQECIDKSGINDGVCFVMVPHASACVTVNENTEAPLLTDMVQILDDLVPQKPQYGHYNSAAHVQTSLFGCSQTLLVEDGKLVLGYWQGIFLVEWDGPRSPRRILVHIMPDEGGFSKIEDPKFYSKVEIVHGPSGWGGPVIVNPSPGKDLVVSFTRGGIHGCAQHIADLAGATPFDGSAASAPLEQIVAVVIASEDTDQVSFYAGKGIPVVSVSATMPAGALLDAVTEDLFVSGVRAAEDVTRAKGDCAG